MFRRFRVFAWISAIAVASAACATGGKPPPAVDPVKEQITILQKQLLELQNIQNETRQQADEQTREIERLGVKVKILEEQRDEEQRAAAAAKASRAREAAKKKMKKPKYRKKTTRRQER